MSNEQPILDSGIHTDSDFHSTKIGDTDREYLNSAGGWAKFMAIVGFVGSGITAIVGIIMFISLSRVSSRYGSGMINPAVSLLYLIIAGLYFLPCLYLFNFGAKIQQTCRQEDGYTTSQAFNNLRLCFRFMGIMTIVIISIYLLMVLFLIGTYRTIF